MAYSDISLESRIKDNIKNYSMEYLFDMDALRNYCKNLVEVTKVHILMTERHGEKIISLGDFGGFTPDVVNKPGRKIRIAGRTVGHLYVRLTEVEECNKDMVNRLMDTVAEQLMLQGEQAYLRNEIAMYSDALEAAIEKEKYLLKHGEIPDPLTGVMENTYFNSRMQSLDRSELIPLAVICLNINDWRYANDHYGNRESDRLIQIVANVIRQEAKPEYIIGRTDGDAFGVIIPMAEEDEARDYCSRVQKVLEEYEDDKLAPSVAAGYTIKTNVEESVAALLSDAEYEMFNHKIDMKKKPGYRERLEKAGK